MKDFTALGLSPELIKGIQELGFEAPTPVQAKVIPIFLNNTRDLVALAQTGTGKTAAYGLPLLQMTDVAKTETQGLILCPTRELCMQIVKDLNSFARHTRGVRTVAVYGGASIGEQIRALGRGAHIIVATPGRMHDLLRREKADLTRVRWVVLDEADEMMNMGFQEEMEAILGVVPDSARTLLFSATMPRQVAAMAGKYMENPEEILCGTRNSGSDTIRHECYKVHARDRYAALKRIMDATPGLYAIIFCRTRVETQELAHHLNKDGYRAEALHGDMTQDQRSEVMGAFRARHIELLVATDVAARGLDVNELTHVIHYNLPDEVELYTHRSGRTGRAGREGTSIVLIHYREEQKLRLIERILKKPFVPRRVPSGHEVCEARLAALLERIRQVDTADGRLEPFMPVIDKGLAELSREEILKRLILLDFDKFLASYKGAPDLNAVTHHGPHGRHDDGGDRRGRQGAGERPSRPAYRQRDPDVARMRVNLGRRNSLTPPDLMGLVNRATQGPALRIGRIHITEHATFFEMSRQDAEQVLPALNRTTYGGREVRAVMETDRPSRGRRP